MHTSARPKTTAPAERFARVDQYAQKDAEQEGPETLEIPEDLSTLSDTELSELHSTAVSAFEAIYGDGNPSDEEIEQLSAISEGLKGVKEELAARETKAAERRARAAELAAEVRPAEDETEDDEEDGEDDDEESDEDGEDGDESAASSEEHASQSGEQTPGDGEQGGEDSLTASAPAPSRRRGPLSVTLPRSKRHLPRARQTDSTGASSMADIAFAAGEGSGYAQGTGIDFLDAGKIVDRRMASVNENAVRAAAKSGRHMRQQMGVMSIRKPIPAEFTVSDDASRMEIEEVFTRASSERRLQGNSLVASGGWCAPSETMYDLLELESRDGLFSIPEVGLSRGGVSRTLGPNFADIYNSIAGFHYTEAQDVAGQYGVDEDGIGNDTDGTKPCYKVECPEFTEYRLEVDGLCITAGLLQQKGYPEVIARTIRGALIAHDHRLAGRTIRGIVDGSTAVTMPVEGAGDTEAAPAGTTAPLLNAIELQVEHLRYAQRISRSATIEGVFPYWIRGAIRADLSKRSGADLLSVTDQQINGWFTARGIAPQFVYNWQDLNGVGAVGATGWPAEVSFLLYPAGSWILGTSDIITVDTLVDSAMLGTNDYTALFTEEGRVVIPMGHDSRVVTVPVCTDGATAAGIAMECNSIALPA